MEKEHTALSSPNRVDEASKDPELEVLVATMNQQDFSLVKAMNLHTDAIIANQADRYDYTCRKEGTSKYQMITTPYRGVGKNRNAAIFAASADICLIADDDLVYYDDYDKIVIEAFNQIKDADIIIFNLTDCEETGRRMNQKIKKLKWYNLLNYGAVRIAFKRTSIINNGILFSTAFGGGAVYSSGEDSLFLMDAYRKKLNIYTYPKSILKLVESKSTWFQGYNEKYFYDKGKFIQAAFPKLKWLIVPIFLYKDYKKTDLGLKKCAGCIYKGAFHK